MKFISLHAREILDSRGVPTVEVVLETEKGLFKASTPSGTSTGKHEAFELRDNEERFFGKGVLKAVQNIEEKIALAIKDKDFYSQKDFDNFLINLDGTENKSNLGTNAILPVSIAFCRALACEAQMPLYKFIAKEIGNEGQIGLPRPCFNILEGGKHAGNNLEVQEFMVAPFFENFKDGLRAGAEVYYHLKLLLIKNFGETAMNTGYESGFAPAFKKTEQAFEFLLKAIQKAGYEGKFKIGLDIAASELLYKEKYKVNGELKSPQKLFDYYIKLCKEYPLVFIEDGFGEDDFDSWEKLESGIKNQELGVIVVGDDLLTTNPKRIKTAQEKELCNGMILKLNQIGSVSEGIEAFKLARSFNWKVIVSHRSGETTDDFIADFSVGVGADFIKTGAPAGGERVVKYNRLLEIEKELY
ncbi:MAG: phosphopyruvate hydratase [Candidatus Pacebacteria bacterium]|nr:phosphopyruvate hydratase [Candidatus Paceibacterota bacterium]